MVCMDAADYADYTEADENGYTVRTLNTNDCKYFSAYSSLSLLFAFLTATAACAPNLQLFLFASLCSLPFCFFFKDFATMTPKVAYKYGVCNYKYRTSSLSNRCYFTDANAALAFDYKVPHDMVFLFAQVKDTLRISWSLATREI